jgi:hypothetical protein
MSDIEIVSANAWRNEWRTEGHVPYGTVLTDNVDPVAGGEQIAESLIGVPSVDWSGNSLQAVSPKPVVKRSARSNKNSKTA